LGNKGKRALFREPLASDAFQGCGMI